MDSPNRYSQFYPECVHNSAVGRMMVYKYNFENATEKRQADKDLGHVLMPDPDGQVKHPEHLQEHEMLQEIQREALYGKPERVKELLSLWPEDKQKDLRKMLIDSVAEHGRKIEL